MATVTEKLYKWSLQELCLVSEGGLSKIPDVETFKILTKGRNKKIWNYVINHVRSQSTVAKVKRTLLLKKQLREQEDNPVYFADNSLNNEKLKDSLLKASEKRKYLLSSLSIIQERILNLDQSVRIAKDEVFHVNQKTALLEHLKQIYDEKNSNLKNSVSRISSYQCELNAYQTSKMFDKVAIDLSYDFLFENKALYDENLSRIKDLVVINSGIFKKQFSQDDDNMNSLKENVSNNFTELKSNGLLLTDLVVLLKEMCKSDLQHFINLSSRNLSVKEYMFQKSKENKAKDNLARLKCDFIYISLSAKKVKDKIEKHSTDSEAAKCIMEKLKIEPSDLDYDMKFALLVKQAENDALTVSNDYVENYLQNITSKTESALKNIRYQKMSNKDVTPVVQLFFKDADLTYNFLYAFPSVIQKVINYLDDLKFFACEDLFKLQYPKEENIESLKESFSSERKQTWDYCTKTKLIEPFFAKTAGDELPAETCQSLNIEPYQNISVLCQNWAYFKQKLYAEIAANATICGTDCNISVSEVYSKILKLLEKIKFSIEKGMLSLNYGATSCQKNKSLIDEWWNQNAQYIPNIEYEGKTLKMWIDILSVLPDFELQSHS